MFRLKQPPQGLEAVVALGAFDGVHLGHRALLDRACALAGQEKLAAVAVTFARHPMTVLAPEKAPALITTADERARQMECLGMDALVELPFTQAVAQTSAEDFIAGLCDRMRVRHMVVGFNYTFGFGGRGNRRLLEELSRRFGFTLHVIDPVLIDGRPVSSSRIRRAIARGDMAQTRRLLGRFYAMEGTVEKGKQLGRKLGFPTLNVAFERDKAVPGFGVYAGWVIWRNRAFGAVTNIGTNPTVEAGGRIHLETHVLEEQAADYGDQVRVIFGKQLRTEARFDSLEALSAHMRQDCRDAQRWLARRNPAELFPQIPGDSGTSIDKTRIHCL
jgi:riboflavin kinase/FMN adenylyltransferase